VILVTGTIKNNMMMMMKTNKQETRKMMNMKVLPSSIKTFCAPFKKIGNTQMLYITG